MDIVQGHELYGMKDPIGRVIKDENGKEFTVTGFINSDTLSLEPKTNSGDFPWFPFGFVKP